MHLDRGTVYGVRGPSLATQLTVWEERGLVCRQSIICATDGPGDHYSLSQGAGQRGVCGGWGGGQNFLTPEVSCAIIVVCVVMSGLEMRMATSANLTTVESGIEPKH